MARPQPQTGYMGTDKPEGMPSRSRSMIETRPSKSPPPSFYEQRGYDGYEWAGDHGTPGDPNHDPNVLLGQESQSPPTIPELGQGLSRSAAPAAGYSDDPRLGDGGGNDPRISPDEGSAAYDAIVNWLKSQGIDEAAAGDLTLKEISQMAIGSGDQSVIDAVGTSMSDYGATPVDEPALGPELQYIGGRR